MIDFLVDFLIDFLVDFLVYFLIDFLLIFARVLGRFFSRPSLGYKQVYVGARFLYPRHIGLDNRSNEQKTENTHPVLEARWRITGHNFGWTTGEEGETP